VINAVMFLIILISLVVIFLLVFFPGVYG